jgi:hypothetical protein
MSTHFHADAPQDDLRVDQPAHARVLHERGKVVRVEPGDEGFGGEQHGEADAQDERRVDRSHGGAPTALTLDCSRHLGS